ncbi:MAG: putative sulfate/molybdate transporter, partial [Deltaproteobacteria bacterium]
MIKIKSFEFSGRELAGSMGDLGVLIPFAIGYISVCGLNPAGFLVMMGLANIATGIAYRLPMPIEPMKVIAIAAIAQHWTPSMIYASGFSMGIIWFFFAITGIVGWLGRVTPPSVIRGIQITLGLLLVVEAYKLLSTSWLLGITATILAVILRQNRYAPGAVVLMALGILIVILKGEFRQIAPPGFNLPPLTGFRMGELWQTLLLAGFAQIPLTVTNATIATSSLIRTYWPDRQVTEKSLSLNQGLMNMVVPFFGGMPMCHGAGGLAGQYYFGARTGGTNIIEGVIEIALGLFMASSVAGLFTLFPQSIIGAMMLLVGFELTRFVKKMLTIEELFPMAVTVAVSLTTNMAYGFIAGIAANRLIRHILIAW